MPKLHVRVDNLKIEADVAVGSRGNPSVTNTIRNMAEVKPVSCVSVQFFAGQYDLCAGSKTCTICAWGLTWYMQTSCDTEGCKPFQKRDVSCGHASSTGGYKPHTCSDFNIDMT